MSKKIELRINKNTKGGVPPLYSFVANIYYTCDILVTYLSSFCD